MNCLLCGSDAKNNYCRKCKEKKANAVAIISQNKSKLRKLLTEDKITLDRLTKFILYTNNIIKYGKVVMQYKEKDTNKKFADVMKIGVVACWLISCVFIFEIAII